LLLLWDKLLDKLAMGQTGSIGVVKKRASI